MAQCGWAAAAAAAGLGIALGAAAFASPVGDAQRLNEDALAAVNGDRSRPAPVDYGYGVGVRPASLGALVHEAASLVGTKAATPPVGDANAGTGGMFGAAVHWPINPIHAILLPDGRVMSYGTDESGVQGAQFMYDVWDPPLGTSAGSHTVLPNTTQTDIFCSGQSMIWSTDEAFITGGDLTVSNVRNFSNNHTTIFDPATDTVSQGPAMHYARWYASVIAQPSGKMLVLGGRQSPTLYAPTPELYDPVTGWQALNGASSVAAYGSNAAVQWFYPRGYLMPDGNTYVLSPAGLIFKVTIAGTGSVTQLPQTLPGGSYTFPSVMFQAGKVLSVRGLRTSVVDMTGATPVISASAALSQLRYWSNATVLADGSVALTGGSTVSDTLTGVTYQTTLWNPATGTWTTGAAAAKPRLYHSIALLLPDGTVLTGGGGSPGPVTNLNAEIYYPPYLYAKDGSGNVAARPSLTTAKTTVGIGQSFKATVGAADQIARMTLVRTGSVTHSQNTDQRFLDLAFTQSGTGLTITLPANANLLLPGYYMLFAINQAGVPSVAPILLVPSPA
ncbi:MAG TPA: galactose oxidase-like domain-containing protein [Stellaceae bacterium]|nr:galactose oxidase-like domain-containing protein [Stellaceae bacterium]